MVVGGVAVEQKKELFDTIVGEARARVTNRWHVVPASPARHKTRHGTNVQTHADKPHVQARNEKEIGNKRFASPSLHPVDAAAAD